MLASAVPAVIRNPATGWRNDPFPPRLGSSSHRPARPTQQHLLRNRVEFYILLSHYLTKGIRPWHSNLRMSSRLDTSSRTMSGARINVNDLERNVIDTPEFQRLFRTSQLGFVDLVYQTANHTRGAHSIGACHVANLLMDYLDENCRDAGDHNKDDDCKPCVGLPVPISPAERVLIRLGALLHDISHVPLSHDIERKSHKIGDNIKVPLPLRTLRETRRLRAQPTALPSPL